jgi:Na+/H+ antiporter NhaC
MTRVLSLVFVLALAGVLFLIPSPEAERLAAAEAGSLLSEEASPGTSMWEALLETPAATEAADGSVTLRLGTSRLVDASGSEHADAAAEARGSLVRALRAIADGEDGLSLEIATPDRDGPNVARTETRLGDGTLTLSVRVGELPALTASRAFVPPGRGALFPPLVAIVFAILFRRPVLALFSGVLLGAFLVRIVAGAGVFGAAFGSVGDVVGTYFRNELVSPERYQIILFVVLMLAMVGVITRARGIRGVMNSIAVLARDVRRTQISTYLMGLAVFFDDYANTILVGSTMRPLSDRFRVAREKLAYIVDSTAAPVAGISVFSTWIAFEVSTFSAQLPAAGLDPGDGYAVFLQTLPYRFYCLFTLFFVGLVVFSGRDFGPMRTAEQRARAGKILRDGANPMVGKAATELDQAPGIVPRAAVALVPLAVFIGVTLFEILRVGGAFAMQGELFTLQGMTTVLYDGSGSRPLMIGSLAGLAVAALLAAMSGIARDVPAAAWSTVRSMGVAIVILYLAWMIGAVCDELNTAEYLSAVLSDRLPPAALPALLFVLAGVIAFATGSSWSTMTILLPLVVGLAFSLGEGASIGGHVLMVISIGAVLEGAIFGDHCSPISDTTVMSSIASASDHIDHVRTQVPYAVTTMVAALAVGYLPAAVLGSSGRPWLPFLLLALGAALLVGVMLAVGRPVDGDSAASGSRASG